MCFSQDVQKTKDSEIPQAMQTPPVLNSDDATTAESVEKYVEKMGPLGVVFVGEFMWLNNRKALNHHFHGWYKPSKLLGGWVYD